MAKQLGKNGPITNSGVKELQRRLMFLVISIFIYRLGSYIPIPGLNPQRVALLFNQHSNGIIGMFNLFSGGALKRLSVFALGIMPYISASIIVQLFTAISPRLKELQKEGESGQRKLNQYTRYGTLFLGLFQAFGMCKVLASNGAALNPNYAFYFTATITLLTGTMALMWLGEQMTERAVGNGISMIIFASIVSRLPSAIGSTLEFVREGQIPVMTLILIVAIVIGVTIFVVFVERGQRKITINYAQRQQGRKIYAAQTSHLPLKLNMSGVIPPIFASSIIIFPATLASWFGRSKSMAWLSRIGVALGPGRPLHIIIFTAAIIFFCFFYTALVFNPKETADNLKRSGAYIPGIRPGEQTSRYIDLVMSRLTLVGAIYVTLVCLTPEALNIVWHVPFYFGGTSLLIIVVVAMDFIAQIQSLLLSHQYESLMKKAKLKGGSGSTMGGVIR